MYLLSLLMLETFTIGRENGLVTFGQVCTCFKRICCLNLDMGILGEISLRVFCAVIEKRGNTSLKILFGMPCLNRHIYIYIYYTLTF